MTPLSKSRELAEMAKRASPRPWFNEFMHEVSYQIDNCDREDERDDGIRQVCLLTENEHGDKQKEANTEFIVAARNEIEELCRSYEEALAVIKFYGTFEPRQHPEGYYEIHISPGMGGEDRFGTRAREFLRKIGEA